ncbi:hypothetical protein BC834DRAFT_123482 [Gloeopeniophorella convolvens]|nr:hypothetical protein BC834DRAFT_123482 [Gloeopeniophorella convolvens]
MEAATPIHRTRNMLHRRGSVSANDPFGIHAEQNLTDERATMSRLTIVRVLPEETQDSAQTHSTPSSPESRRINWSPTSPPAHGRSAQSPQIPQTRRLSFASSSFSQDSPPQVVSNSPPSYASRRRRASTSVYAQRTALTPQQLCDLAQSSVQPRPRSVSKSAESPTSPQSHVHSPDRPTPASIVPTNFLPIPDGQFLPFLDRPTEVLEFISTSPTNRLMALLEQAFPVHLRRKYIGPHENQQPSPNLTGSSKRNYLDTPPSAWSFQMLLDWMSTVSREEADDTTWVRAIRTCVMARSEQMCVNLLAALGVPMEGGADLDVVSLPVGMPDFDVVLPELSTTFAGGPLTQLPTLPEVPVDEGEDAFQLEFLPITCEDSDEPQEGPAEHRSRSHSTSSWSPSSRSSSRLSFTMESIGETENEQDVETGDGPEPDHLGSHSPEEHLSGEATARAGSPVGADFTKPSKHDDVKDTFSAISHQWDEDHIVDADQWRMAWEQVENCYGLSISTCARPAADPSLPSTDPHSAMPHAVASSMRPKQRRNTVQVSHVLSGAPGHEGFAWRPGGPLFPMSFAGPANGGDGTSVNLGLGDGGNSTSLMTR